MRRLITFCALVALAAAGLLFIPTAAQAQIITVDTPTMSFTPGDTDVIFTGSINNTDIFPETLNSFSLSLLTEPPGGNSASVTEDAYLGPTNFNGLSVYNGNLFSVNIASDAPAGIYTGTANFSFGLLGGGTEDASGNFTLNILPTITSAPEPRPTSTLVIGALGICLLAGAAYRKRMLRQGN